MATSFYKNKSVLVTGAAGFVASHLVDAVLKAGAQVVAVDNFLTGSKENLVQQSGNDQLILIEADVINPPTEYLPEALIPDVVFHLASPASPPRYQAYPIETYLVNSLATHHLLDFLVMKNPQARLIFASTSEIYGDPALHPQTEDYWGNVNPNGIRSCYDESKRLGETICGVFNRNFELDVRIMRIFNTYGPRMDPADGRLIPNLITQALAHQPLTIYGDGQQTRSFCYVSDLVKGILLLGSQDQASGKTINLGNPDEYSALQTAQIINHAINPGQELQTSKHPLPADDPTRRKPDITRAQEILGWQPEVKFKAGLEKTIQYFSQLA